MLIIRNGNLSIRFHLAFVHFNLADDKFGDKDQRNPIENPHLDLLMYNTMIRFFGVILMCLTISLSAQPVPEAPLVEEGKGPFNQLIIRGATLINSTGAPPLGPVDIVIEQNQIKDIKVVGYPGVEIDSARRPKLESGGMEIDAHGKFVLPGFVDMHGHIGGRWQGAGGEYVFKLWMAHGITTIRDPSCGNGLDWVLKAQEVE